MIGKLNWRDYRGSKTASDAASGSVWAGRRIGIKQFTVLDGQFSMAHSAASHAGRSDILCGLAENDIKSSSTAGISLVIQVFASFMVEFHDLASRCPNLWRLH